MDITLITSLYRSEHFLPRYLRHLQAVGAALTAHNLRLQVIIVSNDATLTERDLLRPLEHEAFAVRLEWVERERLYTSWNRALPLAEGAAIGFWNVDDIRQPEALIEGHERIRAGCDLIDFPYTAYQRHRAGRRDYYEPIQQTAFPRASHHHPIERHRTGPFFMAARTLFDRVGDFDSRFTICGDFDWNIRAERSSATFCAGEQPAGSYFLHGANLSAGERLAAEETLIMLRYAPPEQWKPIGQPSLPLIQSLWSEFDLGAWTPAIERALWSPPADIARRWKNRAGGWLTRAGLRPLLGRIGFIKRVNWLTPEEVGIE